MWATWPRRSRRSCRSACCAPWPARARRRSRDAQYQAGVGADREGRLLRREGGDGEVHGRGSQTFEQDIARLIMDASSTRRKAWPTPTRPPTCSGACRTPRASSRWRTATRATAGGPRRRTVLHGDHARRETVIGRPAPVGTGARRGRRCRGRPARVGWRGRRPGPTYARAAGGAAGRTLGRPAARPGRRLARPAAAGGERSEPQLGRTEALGFRYRSTASLRIAATPRIAGRQSPPSHEPPPGSNPPPLHSQRCPRRST